VFQPLVKRGLRAPSLFPLTGIASMPVKCFTVFAYTPYSRERCIGCHWSPADPRLVLIHLYSTVQFDRNPSQVIFHCPCASSITCAGSCAKNRTFSRSDNTPVHGFPPTRIKNSRGNRSRKQVPLFVCMTSKVARCSVLGAVDPVLCPVPCHVGPILVDRFTVPLRVSMVHCN
jgi:hypothetical protein